MAELRELEFRRRVPVTVESPGKLAKRLLGVLAEETDENELRRQGRAMELLGELPAGTDLPRLLNRVQAESVLGFYLPGRPPKGGLYVRSSRGLDPYAKIILAHELTHAVTDQRFDLTKADRLAAATAAEDELAAYSGLVEGDATLTMQRYLAERLTPAEQADAGLVASTQRTPERDAAPAVIRQSMLFPYEQGLRFVRTLYAQGGWDAVNDAYRDPPRSTEQLLHPERYLGDRDQPQKVEVADLSGRLGGGWRPAAELSFGELDARLLLQGELAVDHRRCGPEGWDGGRLRTFQRGTAPPWPCGRLGLGGRGDPVLRGHARLAPPLRTRRRRRRIGPLLGDGQRAAWSAGARSPGCPPPTGPPSTAWCAAWAAPERS